MIRSIFKYAYEADLINAPMKFGKGLTKPSAARKRKAAQKAELDNGKNLPMRQETLRIIRAHCTELLGPAMLAINGGFGNTDCATLPLTGADLDAATTTPGDTRSRSARQVSPREEAGRRYPSSSQIEVQLSNDC